MRRADYEAQCAALGLTNLVRFHGAADPTQLSCLYRRASALVLPSRHDSFPTVLLESMASGTPIIASRVGGIPTFVEDGRNGLLVHPGRPEEIASAVKRLDRQSGVRRRTRSRGSAHC